jgi:hypothetical protein
MVKSYGLGSSNYSLEITFPAFTNHSSSSEAMRNWLAQETAENQPVFEELREGLRLMKRKHHPTLLGWIQEVSKIELEVRSSYQRTCFTKELI